MQIIFYILLIITIATIVGVAYLYTISKSNDKKITANLLIKVVDITYVIFGLVYLLGIIVTVINTSLSEVVFILLVKTIINVIVFFFVYQNIRLLLKNLESNIIFTEQNFTLTKKIGELFLSLAFLEVIVGFIYDLLDVISGNGYSFEVTTNFSIFIYVIIGLLLFLVSKILEKAIEIYKENQLTIWLLLT